MEIKEFAKKIFELKTCEYKGINLTAIKSYEEFYVKQIEDSILPFEFEYIKNLIKKNKRIIDIGFGGGYPLLPMAFKFQDKKVIGIDARNKKVKVVQEIANRLGLSNVKTIHGRFEKINIDMDAIITIKAVGKIKDLLRDISSNKNIYLVFYKGKNVDEIEPSLERDKAKGWSKVFEHSYQLSNKNNRKVIVYKNVPCRTIKKLVNLSELL